MSIYIIFFQKIVVANKETLIQLRTSFDKPEMMRDLSRKLQSKCRLSAFCPVVVDGASSLLYPTQQRYNNNNVGDLYTAVCHRQGWEHRVLQDYVQLANVRIKQRK